MNSFLLSLNTLVSESSVCFDRYLTNHNSEARELSEVFLVLIGQGLYFDIT